MSEETIKGSDGNVYDVTDVAGDTTDVVIIKKNGNLVFERQITQKDKDYTIVKKNGTCNIQFYEESNTKSAMKQQFLQKFQMMLKLNVTCSICLDNSVVLVLSR